MGTERLIATAPDRLPEAFAKIDPSFDPTSVVRRRRCFPRALAGQGWRHTFDKLIQRGLVELPWAKGFIAQVKAIVAFFRYKSNIDTIVKKLRKKGKNSIADVVKNIKLVSFAEWRWTKLDTILSKLKPILDVLIQHVEWRWFKNPKDSVQLKTVKEAFASSDFRRQFDFCSWYCKWLNDI